MAALRLLQEDTLPVPPPTIGRRTYHRPRYSRRALNLPRLRREGAIEEEWMVRVNYLPDRRRWFGFAFYLDMLEGAQGLAGRWPQAELPDIPRPSRRGRHTPAPSFADAPAMAVPIRRFTGERFEEVTRVGFVLDVPAGVDRVRLLYSRYVDASPYLEEWD